MIGSLPAGIRAEGVSPERFRLAERGVDVNGGPGGCQKPVDSVARFEQIKIVTSGLEQLDGEVLGGIADRDKGEEEDGVAAEAEDGEVTGGLVGDQKHGRLGAGFGQSETHRSGRSPDVDGFADSTIDDVDREDVPGGTIGNIHFGSIFAEDGGGGSGADQKRVTDFVSPRIDGL